MKNEAEIRRNLRDWILKVNAKIGIEELDDGTPIIERRIISSLQVMDLILFLEKLSERPIEVDKLKPGVFKNIDAIYENFFAGSAG